ncbi:MAG: hypothetical protein ACR2K0_05570 [Acidimicrobiales bacterium]
MVRNRRRVVVLAALAGLGSVACGNGDGEPLTREAFVERGSAICAETTQRIDEAAQGAFSEQRVIPPAEEIIAFASETVAPQVGNELERLSELEPPSDDAERIEQILEAGREGVDTVRRDPTIVQSGADDGFVRYRELASDYGLENCGGISDETRAEIAGIGRG